MGYLIQLARETVRDIQTFGPGIVRHYLNERTGRACTDVVGPRTGPIKLRTGSTDLLVFRQSFIARQYAFDWYPQRRGILAHQAEILARGKRPLIVDLGANNGGSALWFALTFPEACVVAVEPDAENAALCRYNTRGHHVEVLAAAIGATSGAVELERARQEWGVTTTRSATGSVPVVTMDEILAAHPDGELFIVKIDIEGFESDLFQDNTSWVSKAKMITIEPHDWMLPGQATSRAFQSVMGEHDFDLLLRNENLIYVAREREPHLVGR